MNESRTMSHARAGRISLAFPSYRVPIAWVQLAVLFAVLAVVVVVRDVDPDFWWHLRTGQLIFDSGIPRHDVYSWTAAGHSWVAHEWLSEAIIYAVESVFGYAGNVVLFAAAAIASLTLMYRLAREGGAGTKILVLLMLLAVIITGYAMAARPQIFSWLFFATFVYVLERDYRSARPMPLWLLPALMAVWVNIHLGFVFGLVLVAAWGAALSLRRLRGDDADLRRVVFVGAACLLATLLNPHGAEILAYPLRYFEDRRSLALISEWQRPNPLNPLLAPFFIGVLVLGWSVVSRHRPSLFLCIVAIFAAASGLQALRNVPYVGLVLLPVAAPALARRWPRLSRDRDSHTTMPLGRAALVLGAFVVIVSLAATQITGSFSFAEPDPNGYPAGGADYVRDNLAGRRLYNDYGWGGYLIYETYPDVPLFIDGRSDFYRNKIMDEYATIGRLQPGWQELMDTYRIDVALLRKDSRLARALRDDEAWQEVFVGDVESVLVRK